MVSGGLRETAGKQAEACSPGVFSCPVDWAARKLSGVGQTGLGTSDERLNST